MIDFSSHGHDPTCVMREREGKGYRVRVGLAFGVGLHQVAHGFGHPALYLG